MAQGTLTRLTYERLGILLTDAPAYKESGTKYTDLIRVQSMDYGFTHQALDIKAIGSDKLVTRNGQSPVVRAPDVNCGIQYLFAEGQNEIGAGLYIGREGSVLKNFFESTTTDDVNILVVASSEDNHKDLNFLIGESDFENFNVIGIGNAYLTSYSYEAAVGQLPTSSLSYAGSNMKYDVYSSSARPTLPAIKPGINNIESSEEVYLHRSQLRDVSHDRDRAEGQDGHVFDEHHIPEVSTTKPGDIKVTINKRSGGRGGAKLDQIHAAIQNISIQLPIERQDIFGMGSNYVFNRKLKLPIIGQLSLDMVVRGYEPDEVDSFLTKADVYDLVITHPVAQRILGDEGSIYSDGNYFYVAVEKNDWRRLAMKKLDSNFPDFSSADITEHPNNAVYQAGSISLNLGWDENFFYIKNTSSNEYWSIPLTPTTAPASTSENYYLTYPFFYVSHNGAWKRFPLTELNFDLIDVEASFDVAQTMTFEINRAQLKQQNYSHSIGSEVMVSSSLTFDVTKTDGLRMYFQ